MTATLYGIPNCDSVKKARRWLEAQGIPYVFHDYRKSGIDASTLLGWSERLGYGVLLNTRGTTWRKLGDADRADVDAAKAIALMLREPSLIKRPVLARDRQLLVGFDEASWQSLL
ncbi:MAG: ArsC family reductase [Pseudohongiellaceae bacterium]|jgi:Spx/MgsR family transcriptional regulator